MIEVKEKRIKQQASLEFSAESPASGTLSEAQERITEMIEVKEKRIKQRSSL